jgi:hypothetical protein
MPRPAGVGHATVEATPSIDVMRWHRLGYLENPVHLTWAWDRGGGQSVASIRVATGWSRRCCASPAVYLRVIASLVPQRVAVDEHRGLDLSRLSDSELLSLRRIVGKASVD